MGNVSVAVDWNLNGHMDIIKLANSRAVLFLYTTMDQQVLQALLLRNSVPLLQIVGIRAASA